MVQNYDLKSVNKEVWIKINDNIDTINFKTLLECVNVNAFIYQITIAIKVVSKIMGCHNLQKRTQVKELLNLIGYTCDDDNMKNIYDDLRLEINPKSITGTCTFI